MKTIITIGFCIVSIVARLEANDQSLKLEFDRQKLAFRVVIDAGSRTIVYNARAFKPERLWGPAGARAFIRGRGGKEIKCMREGYCSFDMDSGDPRRVPEMKELESGKQFVSVWYDLRDLLRGASMELSSSHARNDVHSMRVTFEIVLKDGAGDRNLAAGIDGVELTTKEWEELLAK